MAWDTTIIIKRGWTIRIISALAFAAAAGSLYYDFIHPVLDDAAGMAGASIGLLGAAAALFKLSGFTEQRRYFLSIIAGAIPGALIGAFATSHHASIAPFAALGLIASAALFLWENGQTIEVGAAGLTRRMGWPFAGETAMPWDRIETMVADLRQVTVYGVGQHTYSEGNLYLRGDGRTLAIQTPRSNATYETIRRIAGEAMAPTLAWTVKQVREQGRVRLGSVELRQDGVAIAPGAASKHNWSWLPTLKLGGLIIASLFTYGVWFVLWLGYRYWRRSRPWPLISWSEVKEAKLEQGLVCFQTNTGALYLGVSSVPNALILPQAAQALSGK